MASTQTGLPYLSRTNTNQSLSPTSTYPDGIVANTSANSHTEAGANSNPDTSFASFTTSARSASQMSHSRRPSRSPQPPMTSSATATTNRTSDPSSSKSKTSSGDSHTIASSQHSSLSAPRRHHYPHAHPPRKLRSQYPRGPTENHVEYILVASFDIDRGPVMEHQYPVAITGDENMLAELMLPDQAHARTQDWTIFFLSTLR